MPFGKACSLFFSLLFFFPLLFAKSFPVSEKSVNLLRASTYAHFTAPLLGPAGGTRLYFWKHIGLNLKEGLIRLFPSKNIIYCKEPIFFFEPVEISNLSESEEAVLCLCLPCAYFCRSTLNATSPPSAADTWQRGFSSRPRVVIWKLCVEK